MLGARNDNTLDNDQMRQTLDDRHRRGMSVGSALASGEDKENKRWYGQEIGLNLWQTTLGAAVLLGTGFGSG